MKRSFFSLLFILYSLLGVLEANAFYHLSEIERADYRVDLEVTPEQSTIKLLQKLRNQSDAPKTFRYYFPLLGRSHDVQFFVDALGHPYGIEEGETRLNMLFEKARDTQASLYFRLGAPPYEKLLVSDPITLRPGESKDLKLTFQTPLDFVNDFYFSEVFLHDEKPSQHFEMAFSLSSSETIQHFLINLLDQSLMERYQRQIIGLFEAENYTAKDQLRFFWSHLPNPTLQYLSQGEIYHGHFTPPQRREPTKQAMFVLDTSGSMNGSQWKRAQQYLDFLLQRFGDEVEVKILLVDDEVRLYPDENWQKNTYEFRRELSDQLSNLKPLGTFELLPALTEYASPEKWTVPETARALVLITDSPHALDYNPEIVTAPLIVLHFDGDQTDLDLLAHFSGGFFQKLFKSPPLLIEAEEWLKKWEQWKAGRQNGPVQITRTLDETSVLYSPLSHFLPSLWGAQTLSQLLDDQTYGEVQLQAMLSIAHRFGIQKDWLDPQIHLADWKQLLEQKSPAEIKRLIMNLQASSWARLKTEKMVKDIPFYPREKGYTAYHFHEKVSPHTLIQIAPFSEAQRQLFLRFPDQVAQSFAISPEVDFCTDPRCISVRWGHRREPIPEDRFFFRDYDPTHWANPYLGELIDRGLLQAEPNGRLHPDRAIDRGSFAELLVGLENLETQELENLGTPLFSDLNPEASHFEAVQYLAQKGVVKGYAKDSTFRPLQDLTRGEAIKMMLALKGWKPGECSTAHCSPVTENPFSDIEGWSKEWILEAWARGWVQGFSDGTFRPHDPLSKAEAAKLLLSR